MNFSFVSTIARTEVHRRRLSSVPLEQKISFSKCCFLEKSSPKNTFHTKRWQISKNHSGRPIAEFAFQFGGRFRKCVTAHWLTPWLKNMEWQSKENLSLLSSKHSRVSIGWLLPCFMKCLQKGNVLNPKTFSCDRLKWIFFKAKVLEKKLEIVLRHAANIWRFCVKGENFWLLAIKRSTKSKVMKFDIINFFPEKRKTIRRQVRWTSVVEGFQIQLERLKLQFSWNWGRFVRLIDQFAAALFNIPILSFIQCGKRSFRKLLADFDTKLLNCYIVNLFKTL